MRISGVETRLYRIPLAVKCDDPTQRIPDREFVVSTVATDSGISGTGFAYTYGAGGRAVRELIDAELTPLVLGGDPLDVERIWALGWRALSGLGPGGMIRLALAPLDIALWDILAKRADVPLYRLLGGFRDRIPAYASGIILELDEPQLLDQMRGFLERGYRAVKMKVGRDDPEEDVSRVAAVRRVIGPKVKLMLDAVQRWTAGEAVRRAAMLRPFDPAWLEEPLRAEDRVGHAHVRQAAGIPIALGEALQTRQEFADFIRAGAVDIVQPDIPRIGGFTEWMKIAKMAECFDLPVAPHFLIELSVHALCASPNGLILEDLQGGSLTELGILAEPIRVVDGAISPPERPGHGIVLDHAALRQHEVPGQYR